ncbi:hypothetical protein [Prevotella sp.]|uniref:hypothetical protein n=1 Tax=Prevotella sp. TaxID=59823 RepID=UPI003076BCD8
MDNNTNNKHAAGGPPMTFAMPMYHDFVPKWIRPWIYVVLAFCFQLSNGMYLGAMNNIVGEWGIMREDVQMCLYATLIGMALYFPVLFRMKFRFSNKLLLMTSAAVIVVCNLLATFRMPLPLLWALCVVCGMAKIQGTFECMSTIQLWMTPKRDFGVFFPILHIILLSSIEVAAYLAAWFAYDMHWTYMHWLVIALMLVVLLVQALLTRPFHAMPQIVPLKGIDWFGALLWCVLWLQVAWLLNYGDWLDWWHSSDFRLVMGTMLITLAVCLQRMMHHPKPYIEPAMWTYHNVVPVILLIGVVEALFSCEHVLEMVYYEEVMHYADHTYEALNQWSLPGIVAGCLFSIGWLKLMRWNVYKLIALALVAFCIYAGGFYVLVDSNISIEQLRIPILWRGFSYAVLCISFMWCLHAIMSFEHFFQALSVFNVLHMFVGGLVGAALHGRGMKYYVADGFARYSGYVDSVRMSARAVDFPQMMNGIVEGFLAQSVKILFGWTLIAGLFFAALMLLWDIPMVRHQVKHIPAWPVVGMRVLRGVQRQRRLKRLRHLRRSLKN